MQTHDQVVAQLMRRPAVRQEVEQIEQEEGAQLDLLLKARLEAGPTQTPEVGGLLPAPHTERDHRSPP